MITDKLENEFKTHILLYLTVLCAVFGVSFYFISVSLSQSILIFLLSLFLYEILIRIIYYLVYGNSYKNKLYSPILIDHKIYGYSFPSNFNSKEYNKLLFDSYLFKSKNRNIMLGDNINSRVAFTTNNKGFRGGDFNKSNFKIFCCGGSTTACSSCDDDDTWPAILNQKFGSNNYDIEVVNAGIQGWYSYQNLLKIKHEIINYDPSVIILHHGWNEEFNYSSLKLGRDWTPKVVRNNINTNITYTKPDKFPLLNKIIIFFLIKKITHFNYNFKKSMSFLNKERWEVLKKEEYLVAWFEVLLDIFEIAQKNNIMIFMINPPSLVDVHDSKINRGIYISNSRLDRWFANYQAISGARISNFLSVIDKFGSIPVMNCKSSFEKFQGLDRLRLFTDEIHLSAAGNKVLANDVFSFLKHNKVFNKFYKEGCNK